jgi:hypothetical protein
VHGKVTVNGTTGGAWDEGVAKVCVQRDYWGPDARVARAIEQAFQPTESAGISRLRRLPTDWPVSRGDRALLGEFIAAQVVRSPSFRARATAVGEEVIREETQRLIPSPELDREIRAFRADTVRQVDTLLSQLTGLASVLCSMHWALVDFGDDLLITGDHPVVALPPIDGTISPVSAVPEFGYGNAFEISFPLDSRHALMFSWQTDVDAVAPLAGTYEQACSLNCAVRAQTLAEWVHRPGTKPPFRSPPHLVPRTFPMSRQLLSGYDPQAWANSERRKAADRLMTRSHREETPRRRIRWVRPDEPNVKAA